MATTAAAQLNGGGGVGVVIKAGAGGGFSGRSWRRRTPQFPSHTHRLINNFNPNCCLTTTTTTSCAGFLRRPYPLSLNRDKGFLVFSSAILCRNKCFLSSHADNKQLTTSDYDHNKDDAKHDPVIQQSPALPTSNGTLLQIDKIRNDSGNIPSTPSHFPDIRRELLKLSLPAIAGQAIEPLVVLLETAYIGRLGSLELASAGISVTIFNTISKLFNIPLLSVATSFVAEDVAKNTSQASVTESTNGEPFTSPGERQQLSSVSTALVLAIAIGIFEALALLFGSGFLLNLMGISPGSSMRTIAQQFLCLRALGAPAFVVSLALQGIFRGFKDTRTPVYCLGFGNLTAMVLFPLLMYYCKLGVYGAAISTILSQYIVTFAMIYFLNKKAVLLPPKFGALQFGCYLKSGGFLIGRTLAVLLTMILATSMAARQGHVAMAAHQICFQVWLAVSLITDALATSSQALIASYFSKGDYESVREITQFVLKIGLFTGVSLAALLGVSFSSLSTFFTKDTEVLKIVATGVLFVSASQPINALAFIFDGLHYGVSDFPYAARSMMLVGALSSACLLYAPPIFGLSGVWSGLTLFMGLRVVAGFIRIMSKESPWWFLHADLNRAKLAGSEI